jgi:uncharacterized protein YndB with AHSA1/START domain
MDRFVTHTTFSLERVYPVPVAQVFAAWADPAAKARWFAPGPTASTLSAGEDLATVSVTTVELSLAGEGTQLVLTEQATFLDGREEPEWREHGTGEWLDALGAELVR